jgi:hypothetical protein
LDGLEEWMRRGVVFAILAAPAAVWAIITILAQSEASGWIPALGELSLPIRVVLASNRWIVRVLPFVAVPVSLLWPLIVLGLAALTGTFSGRNTATLRDIVIWWCVSVVFFAAMFLTGVVYFLRMPEAEFLVTLMASLAWMGIVAFWVSMVAAYAVQQKRYVALESTWRPGWLLAAVAALNCVGLYTLPVLDAIVFRKGQSTNERAVERKSVPPESPSKTLTDRGS